MRAGEARPDLRPVTKANCWDPRPHESLLEDPPLRRAHVEPRGEHGALEASPLAAGRVPTEEL